MSKRNTKISRDQSTKITKHLQELQEKVQTEFSARDIVNQNKDLIKHAIEELNHTFGDIAKMLAEHGAEITATTLRSYLREPQKKPAASRKRKTVADKITVRPTHPDAIAEQNQQNATQVRSSSLSNGLPTSNDNLDHERSQ